MPAHAYDEMLALVTAGRVQPELLVTRQLALDELADALVAMGEPGRPPGLTVLVQKA
jgi:alcohol dehydrogenase